MTAVENLLRGSAELLPFDVPGDLGDVEEDGPAPVIVINPCSSDEALLSSVTARARRLERALDAWRGMSESDIKFSNVIPALHAFSFEISMLLTEMGRRRLARSGGVA